MLEIGKNAFQEQQNKLLKTVLDNRFFLPWRNGDEESNGALESDASLEIFLTNTCNQKCEYCYLKKYPGLYPKEISDPELILQNLKILYEHILEEKYSIPCIDFFSGEIWHTDFGLKVLDLSLEYMHKGMKVGWWLIPSNCSFILDPIQTQKIQHYINEFEKIGSRLAFSISVDGKILEQDSRAMVDGTVKDDEYWENLFAFAKHNNYFFHPMVSAHNVKNWIENYEWFRSQFQKYDMNIETLMMLEVRNSEWEEEDIDNYNRFNKYLLDRFFYDKCGGDVKKLAKRLFLFRQTEDDKFEGVSGYTPYAIPLADDFIGCTCATSLAVRVGDLAIIPCHRLAYNKYLYGKFIVESGKIVGIEANNPQVAIKILMTNFNEGSLGCDNCVFKDYCLKGCFGSQYETHGDPFIPSINVCHFFARKYSFLLNYYKELGLISYLKTVNNLEIDSIDIKPFLRFYDKWEKWYQEEMACLGKKEN